MQISDSTGDEAALKEIGERLAQYRLNENLSQVELSKRAGVGRNTILRIEAGETVQTTNLIRTLRALGLAQNLDALVPAPMASPLELARRQGKARVRASGRVSGKGTRKVWEWGDSE